METQPENKNIKKKGWSESSERQARPGGCRKGNGLWNKVCLVLKD